MAIEHKNYNPDLMAGADNSTTGPTAITSVSNQALAVGRQGATNPALNIDSSTASQADGVNVKGLAAGNGAEVSVITSGTNSPLKIDAAGSGTITIAGTSTGRVTITPVTTVTGVLTTTGGILNAGPVTGLRRTPYIVASDASTSLSSATSGGVYLATKGSATQTFVLPAATVAGAVFTFVCGHASGEILLSPDGSDVIQAKATGDGGADITPAGGTGIKNTAATNVIGDHITIVADGVSKWYTIAQSGIWASR